MESLRSLEVEKETERREFGSHEMHVDSKQILFVQVESTCDNFDWRDVCTISR
jgi:hypothetical protein